MQTLWRFEAIGTAWTLSVDSSLSDRDLVILQEAARRRIEAFDKTYSRFRDDSQVTQWHTPGTYALPDDAYPLFTFYRDLYNLTDGLVTPLIGTVMEEAGYDAAYSFKQGTPIPAPEWDDALEFTRTELTIHQPVMLDFGAAGKGYLVDLITELISANKKVHAVTVNAGGDIRHWSRHGKTSETLRIGLENPLNTKEVIGVSLLSNESICASSGSKRQWGSYHHIINPRSLHSPTSVLGTWVKAESAMIADGLTTALFFVDPKALTSYAFEYAVLRKDGALTYSPAMLQEVFST